MQFQFSVCMYGTCGRIDNKADFDFDFDYCHMELMLMVLKFCSKAMIYQIII